MSVWTELCMPVERELVIGLYDLRNYTAFCRRATALEALDLVTGYHGFVGKIIADAGGLLIKAIGDAGLFSFLGEAADEAIRAMRAFHTEGNRWLDANGYPGHVRTVMHVGPVAIGKIGGPGREYLDIIGAPVNIVGAMRAEGDIAIAITPALFRKLSAETRALFKKHTPPISYIGVDDRRPG